PPICRRCPSSRPSTHPTKQPQILRRAADRAPARVACLSRRRRRRLRLRIVLTLEASTPKAGPTKDCLSLPVALPLSSRPLFAGIPEVFPMFYAGTILSLLVAAAAVWSAVRLFQQIVAKDPGDEAMRKIARDVQNGARAFLHAEYRWLCAFAVVVFALIWLGGSDKGLGIGTAVAFLLGASASAGAGDFGMHCSPRAAVRTTQAAKSGIGAALDIAFKSGTVMGMTVVGFGLIGISLLLLVYGKDNLAHVLGFSFGASSIALFARVGG